MIEMQRNGMRGKHGNIALCSYRTESYRIVKQVVVCSRDRGGEGVMEWGIQKNNIVKREGNIRSINDINLPSSRKPTKDNKKKQRTKER